MWNKLSFLNIEINQSISTPVHSVPIAQIWIQKLALVITKNQKPNGIKNRGYYHQRR